MACSNLSLLTLGCFAPHPILIHEVSVLDIFTYSDNSLDFGALIILLDNNEPHVKHTIFNHLSI